MTDYVFRPGKPDDFADYFRLYRAEAIETYGSFAMSENELMADWEAPGYDMTRHLWAALNPEGEMVAYNELRALRQPPVRPFVFGYVLPEHRGRGIGTELLRRCKLAAEDFFSKVPEGARITLQAASTQDSSAALLQNEGFSPYRESRVMQIALDDTLPAAQLPAGYQIITLAEHPVLEDFARVAEASFHDHRGHVVQPLADAVKKLQQEIDANNSFDPTLFMLLRQGDQDAGVLLAYGSAEDDENIAWIETFGIMPAFRRRGLATQMLLHAFNVFRAYGKHAAGLSVDGSSLTGANHLYEKAGMFVRQVYKVYECLLRDGEEISVQG